MVADSYLHFCTGIDDDDDDDDDDDGDDDDKFEYLRKQQCKRGLETNDKD